MTLGIRKLAVLILVGAVFLLANWLEKAGAVDFAKHVRKEYLPRRRRSRSPSHAPAGMAPISAFARWA